MAKKPGNVPILLAVILAVFLALFFKNTSLDEGQEEGAPMDSVNREALGAADTVLAEETDSTTTEPEEVLDSLSENSAAVSDSLSEEEVGVTQAPDSPVAVDSLLQADSAFVEKNLPYYTLQVRKSGKKLVYLVNQKETDNLMLTISNLDEFKPFVLKFADNITYAEEKEVKDMLEAREIDFTVE
ncbi:hypothetical protein R9C00_04485 [Flammeovirgaceae bacterium SG7u.111]|nr:hypothetical protein [Flammeovirgaceae bacterium SG7u.132]WPO36704.1 hypothetical protein R9C00_04485 [Flammeovirgaceae bacterium SG7u.111]